MLVGALLVGVGALGGGLLGDVDEEEEEEEEEEETARIASSKEPTAVVCSQPDLPLRRAPHHSVQCTVSISNVIVIGFPHSRFYVKIKCKCKDQEMENRV